MMPNDPKSHNQVIVWIRWIARIWSAPIILYALLMLGGYAWNLITIGVADPYTTGDYPPIEAVPPILLFASILCFIIAWRWERLGGALALAFQLAALVALLAHRPIISEDYNRSAFPYLLVLFVIGPSILFLISGWRSRKATQSNPTKQENKEEK